jgi:hypothetical protein
MSFLSNIEALWQKDEAWVVSFFAKVKQDVVIVEGDLMTALNWLAAHAQQINTDLQGLLGVVSALGLTISPPVAAAVTAANVGVAAINAVVAAVNQAKANGQSAGSTIAAAGVAAYQQLKTTQSTLAAAQSHVAASGTTP